MLIVFVFVMMTKDRVAATWISLIFLLFTEIILFGGFIMIEYLAGKASQIVIRAGCGFVLVVYSIISMIVSMYYIISVNESVKQPLTIQAVLLGGAVILFTVFYTTSVSINDNGDKVINSTVRVRSVVEKLNLISKDISNDKYKKELEKISEDLRYTDISTSVPCDEKINQKLVRLELALLKESDSCEVIKLLDDMFRFVNKRKFEVMNTKFGGV